MADPQNTVAAFISFLIILGGSIILILWLKKTRIVLATQKKDSPLSSEVDDDSWFYYANPKSRSHEVIGVGVYTTMPFEFRLETLDTFDKLAAALGFCTPIPTGDIEFDDQIYAYSTNRFFYQALSSNPNLRKTIVDIFHTGLTSLYYEKGQIVASGGKGRAMFGRQKVDDEPALELSKKLHDCIRDIAHIQLDPSDISFVRAGTLDKKMKTFFLLSFTVGIIIAFLCGSGIFYQLSRFQPLLQLTAICSGVCIVGVLLLLRSIMSGTPYGADSFRNFILFGIVAIAAVNFTALYAADIGLDKSAPAGHLQPIARKYFTTGKHNSHTYYLTVDGWNNAQPVDLHVSEAVYNRTRPGQRFHFFTHPGFFNIEWISLQ